MRWFGESWGAPVNEDTPHAPTPVGEPCTRCGKAIAEDARGFLVPSFVEDGGVLVEPLQVEEVPFDLRCWLASVIGDQMADEVLDEVALRDEQR